MRQNLFRLIILATFGFLGWGHLAPAVDVQVNTHTTGTQSGGDVDSSADQVVVVWHSAGQDGDGWGVFARRFDHSGQPLSAEIAVNTHTAGDQSSPTIGVNDSGGFVVVWQGGGPGDADGLFARLFDREGVPFGVESPVNSQTAGSQHSPDVDADSQGNFVVGWRDDGEENIKRRRFDLTGAPVGPEFVIDSDPPPYYGWPVEPPEVAVAPGNGFVVAWAYNGEPFYDGGHVRVNVYDSDGNDTFSELVWSERHYDANEAGVTMDDSFVVGSASYRGYSYDHMVTKTFDLEGDLISRRHVWGPSRYLRHGAGLTEGGGFLLVWADDYGLTGIFGQPHDTTTGDPVDEAIELEPGAYPPMITADVHGETMAWTKPDDSDLGVFARFLPIHFLSHGEPLGDRWSDLWRHSRIDVPACATSLNVDLTDLAVVGDSAATNGDLQLLVRSGARPTLVDHDCLSDSPGLSDEHCTIQSPATGLWWVAVAPASGNPTVTSFTLEATLPGCGGELPISHWQAQGNADDSVGANHGTTEGSLAYTAGLFGQAFALDGVDDAVRVPHDVSLDVGTGDLSVSFWLRTSQRDGQAAILDKRSSVPETGIFVYLIDGRPAIRLGDGSTVRDFVDERSVADGLFHHVAITIERAMPGGGRMLVDGRTALVFDPFPVSGSLDTVTDLMIGRQTDQMGGGGYFTGAIDEVEYFENAVPRPAAADLLNSLVAWWPGNGDLIDIGGRHHGLVEGGIEFTHGRYGQGFSFDGVDGAVRVADAPSLNMGTADFSAAYWVRTTWDATRGVILDKRVNPVRGIQLFTDQGMAGIQIADGTHTSYSSGQYIADGELHFIAVTLDRDSATGGIFYIDGQPVATFDPTSHQGSLSNPADLTLGRRTDETGGAKFFDGLVDEPMIFDRPLTAAEVEWLYSNPGPLFFDGLESGDTSAWVTRAE